MDISAIDKNFKIPEELGREDITFYDVREEPFKVYGLYDYKKSPSFCRLPEEAAKNTSEGVHALSRNTAGGRVRFKTSSSFIAIKALMPPVTAMSNMTLIGQAGFDLYVNKSGRSTYYGTFRPQPSVLEGGGFASLIDLRYLPQEDMRDITINFPLYASVDSLYIGLQDGAELLCGDSYKYEKPIVFYGSSITQGGCASRPGNSYQGFLSRRFDTDYINLGFSGCAKAEAAIADYIKDLDMSVFVYDYDHNAKSIDFLQATHEKMFQTIRTAQPSLPVVFMSAPDIDAYPTDYAKRRNIIFDTYSRALASGDENVYYIDGMHLFGGDCRDACTVDSCHPNDLGFYRMADALGAVLSPILAEREPNRL